MTWFITCSFILLQICLMPSKAMLSPPNNLSVVLLDFKATVEWLPGQGNPPGTRHTVELILLQNMSEGKWNHSANCTNIAKLKCELTFDRHPDDLFGNYFVRVKSTFKGTSSNWTTISKSFQPYGETRLSSPDVKVSNDQQAINITYSHWLEFKPDIKPHLKFHLFLFENNSVGESKFVAMTTTSNSFYIFHGVPSGKSYCVNVSASHQQASHKENFNTTKCIFLSDSPGSSLALKVYVVAMLLITFITGIALAFICFNHIRPKINNQRIPDALFITTGTKRVLKPTPEEPQTITLAWQKTFMNTEDCVSAFEEESGDGSLFYHQRECLTNVVINSPSVINQEPTICVPNLDEEAETLNQYFLKYSLATDMEESEENIISDIYDENITSNLNLSSFILPEIPIKFTLNKLLKSEMDRDREEDMSMEKQTCPQSSGHHCEGVMSLEEEEDVSLLPDSSSDSGYEPRQDLSIYKVEAFSDL
ncbi:cytokine receptor family member B12 isoform X2 [Myxocyprinus asiaticus]|uniref:cytokine receptor family member B12 isoform X2 n=1 Tax=Myxocyprinus asiaticus TaxID=70543 RepID=UPI0022216B9B|nr:cytokine receptor family member B12 isoform X2 [Myxocyprinus asiaticus]